METVNWSFITNAELGADDHPACILPLIPKNYKPFKNLSKEIVTSRKGVTYLKCPAHTDFLKNTFIFCAPFDLTIDLEVNPENDMVRIYCENISQEVFEQIIDTRFLFKSEQGNNPYPLIGIDWLTIFTAKTPLMLQVLPAFMHYNDFTAKATVIPGEYDISKWTRPVEVVFEVRSNKEKIVIKKGDALSYVKFLTDETVKLAESATPWDEMIDCNNIRLENKFRPLKERYKSLEEKRASKCPFSHE